MWTCPPWFSRGLLIVFSGFLELSVARLLALSRGRYDFSALLSCCLDRRSSNRAEGKRRGGLHVVKLLWESGLTNLLNALWAVSRLCWPPSLCPTIPPLSLNSCILSFFNSSVRVFLAALPLLCVTCAHLQRQRLLKGKISPTIPTVRVSRGWWRPDVDDQCRLPSDTLIFCHRKTLWGCGGQGLLNSTCSHLDSALSHGKKGKKKKRVELHCPDYLRWLWKDVCKIHHYSGTAKQK